MLTEQGAMTSHTTMSGAATARSERTFHVFAASLMLACTLGGFRFFILHGKGLDGDEITGQILPLVVIHGLSLFGWVVLFLVQSLLIMRKNRALHTVLGKLGAVFAALIVVLGTVTSLLSVHFNPTIYEPFGGAGPFLWTLLGEMVTFGGLVAAGVYYRRRAEIHRPMMLLATIVITSGGLARMPYLSDLGVQAPLYVHGPTLLFATLILLVRWGLTRNVSRWYAAGYGVLVLAALLSVAVGTSAGWLQITKLIVP